MAKTFLRSGNLDAVLALGENGQPVYASALQIRETLRLRRQNALANCLAIPQANERGDRLDWYSPFSGKVKSWLGASEHERRQALQQLTVYQQDMNDLSARAREAENPAMRLFGALLSKTLQFPDQQYVYLVDGKPVITFWGFVNAQARSREDALSCLRDSIEASLPKIRVEPSSEPVIKSEPVPVEQIAAEPVIAEPVRVEQAISRRSTFRPGYVILPVAVAAAIVTAVLLHTSPSPAPVTPATSVTQSPIKSPPIVASAEKLAATLPQKTATVAAAVSVAPSATLASVITPPVPTVSTQSSELVISSDDVRTGAVKVVDGSWRVVMQNSLPGGASPVLHYAFNNGKGSAIVTLGNNVRCEADEVSAAMVSSGQMVIRSRYTAKCSDGSRYRMPRLICKPGLEAAVCEARFSGDKAFPMTIKRENK